MYSIYDPKRDIVLAIGLEFTAALIVRAGYEKQEKRFDFIIMSDNELTKIW